MTAEDANGNKSARQVRAKEIRMLFYSTGSLKITKSILTKLKEACRFLIKGSPYL